MSDVSDEDLSKRNILEAVRTVVFHRPKLTVGMVVLTAIATLLEGVGLSFIVPIVDIARNPDAASQSVVTEVFARVYEVLGIPFTLETIIVGVAVVLLARFSSTLAMEWLLVIVRLDYERMLRRSAFERALNARTAYFDWKGSDEILNSIR
jgi:subfamily B ATP-binding cassette protein MsbA